jgi:hypothetical protein
MVGPADDAASVRDPIELGLCLRAAGSVKFRRIEIG